MMDSTFAIYVVVLFFLLLGWNLFCKRLPRPTGLRITFSGDFMAQEKATISWDKYTAAAKLFLAITVNGVAQPLVSLTSDVTSYVATVNEKDVLHVELYANDGLDSPHAVADATAPELTPPPAPTGLKIGFAPA